jgi:hypothetical protein
VQGLLEKQWTVTGRMDESVLTIRELKNSGWYAG